MKITEYKGIKLASGRSAHPHWEKNANTLNGLMSHDEEHTSFMKLLEAVGNKKNPVMVELGSNWCFWSLCFRKRFPEGSNYIIELGKRQLDVGLTNFKLNEYSVDSEWGGLFLNDSNEVEAEKALLERGIGNFTFDEQRLLCTDDKRPLYADEDIHFNKDLEGEMVGPELDFVKVYNDKKLEKVDILHMDIQGSEYPLLKQLKSSHILNNIMSMVVATHSPYIHNEVKTILEENNFTIVEEAAYGSVGGDGMFLATKEEG